MGIKSFVYRGRPRVKTEECKDHRLYRATPPDRDTGKGYKYRFLFLLLVSVFYNHSLLCVGKLLLFFGMRVWLSVIFLGLLIN